MSLDELLKDSGGSSAWTTQKKKLLRVLVGILVMAVTVAGGAYLLSSQHRHTMINKNATTTEEEAKSLSKLMSLQNQAGLLKDEILKLRAPAQEQDSDETYVRPRHRRYSRAEIAPTSAVAANQVIDFDPGEGFVALNTEKANLYIPTGAVFIAQLITPIKTSVERTFVMAETIREFRMDSKRRIPRGSRLIGRSHLDPVLKGVVVEFETLVLPSGIETTLAGLGLSRNALPEIEGLYFSDKLETYGVAMAFGFLSGFSSASQATTPTAFGPVPQVNLSNQVMSGLSTSSFQVAQSILNDIQQRAIEYVVVPAGEQIFVALTRRYDISVGGSK